MTAQQLSNTGSLWRNKHFPRSISTVFISKKEQNMFILPYFENDR